MSTPSTAPDDTTHTFITGLDLPAIGWDGPKPQVKRLHRSDSETIVRIAFAEGQVMPEHMAAHPIVVLGQTGEIDFEVGGETFRLEPGSAIRVAARVPHTLTAATAGTVTLIVVHGRA
ncbi:cupin domain-containing protein [Gordonia shandongensis]|uniref:cupin domain-containing protein n=1 Tax=Gordonia shandongensis TaxID=376351 RepID=UPI000421EC8E|nr:cupin domain-containing protein [Gordonia shandongensis]